MSELACQSYGRSRTPRTSTCLFRELRPVRCCRQPSWPGHDRCPPLEAALSHPGRLTEGLPSAKEHSLPETKYANQATQSMLDTRMAKCCEIPTSIRRSQRIRLTSTSPRLTELHVSPRRGGHAPCKRREGSELGWTLQIHYRHYEVMKRSHDQLYIHASIQILPGWM